MRILIDECIDERLRRCFPGHDCQTARYAQLTGLRNGELLLAAEAAAFEALVAVDQGIPYQQILSERKTSIRVLCAPTNRLSGLRRLLPAALEALGSLGPGQVIRIPDGC